MLPYTRLEAILYTFDTLSLSLSPLQMRILIAISKTPGISTKAILSTIKRDRSNISRAIHYLKSINLIEIQQAPNKIGVCYFTTQEGDSFFIDLINKYTKRLAELKSLDSA